MTGNDLHDSLAALADHAQRTARLHPAATIRARGDRRRVQRRTATGALSLAFVAALGVGVASALPGGGDDGDRGPATLPPTASATQTPTPSETPTPTETPTPSETPSVTQIPTPSETPSPDTTGKRPPADAVLNGTRKVVIVPVPSFESVLHVNDAGRLSLTDGGSDTTLFAVAPAGDKFQIKLVTAGKATDSCLRVRTNGSQSLTVVKATCDAAADDQLFEVDLLDRDDAGRGRYAISNLSAYLQVTQRGDLIAEELGDAELTTTFRLVDNGPVR